MKTNALINNLKCGLVWLHHSALIFEFGCGEQGKAPAFIADDLQNGFPSGYSLKSKECEAIITIGDKRVCSLIFPSKSYFVSYCFIDPSF